MSPNPGRPGRLGAILLAAVMLSACGAGATPSAPTTPAPTASPAAVADDALVADLSTAFDEPFDAAKVAELYATDATLYDRIANVTSTGLEAIQARFSQLAGVKFISRPTSATISQDDFVAFFEEHGDSRLAQAAGLVVLQVRDGKILNQWVYDAGPLPEASQPAAGADEALVADLAAVMSTPYDATKVAALYAPEAVIHETTANMTQRGLDEIGARIREFNASEFEAVVTSAPIRQGDFVAHFAKYGTAGDLSGRALVVYQLWDGKVVNQWVYPAE